VNGCYYNKPSKEEIQEAKQCLKDTISNTYAEGKAKKLDTVYKYIEELEADNYEANNIINDYIDERRKLIEQMQADKMERFDDYVIYLIEKYLDILGENK